MKNKKEPTQFEKLLAANTIVIVDSPKEEETNKFDYETTRQEWPLNGFMGYKNKK